MFDWFANWFGKKVVNETGKTLEAQSFYKDGHFSLDLTFLVIIVCAALCCGVVFLVKRRLDQRYKKKVNIILDSIEMKPLKTKPASSAPIWNPSETKHEHIYPGAHLP